MSRLLPLFCWLSRLLEGDDRGMLRRQAIGSHFYIHGVLLRSGINMAVTPELEIHKDSDILTDMNPSINLLKR